MADKSYYKSDEKKEGKIDRMLELLFRAMKGESLSVQKLAYEYNVSPRSISRDITNLRMFLSDHADIVGADDLTYSSENHCYTLGPDHLLTNKELLAVTKVLIGSRAFNNHDLLEIIDKLKKNTTYSDKTKLGNLIKNELYHYNEIGSDCQSVIDNIWKITECIENKSIITISYHKMSREQVKRKIMPVSIMFSEYYFYLIAYKCNSDTPDTPIYFRIDRIVDITVHREKYVLTKEQNVEEGLLRQKSQFMWPGPSRRIRFEFTGPSVQAILDRIPTAKVVERATGKAIIEAEVFGEGIKMFLLSQGSWVKVLAPDSFAQEMKAEIEKMQSLY